jgi:hypothetical protein
MRRSCGNASNALVRVCVRVLSNASVGCVQGVRDAIAIGRVESMRFSIARSLLGLGAFGIRIGRTVFPVAERSDSRGP